jgi:AGCS family alanine or glycine:cation symporter
MDIALMIKQLSEAVVGLPLLIIVIGVSIFYTIALHGIQFRYFLTAFKATLFPSQKGEHTEGQMSPFHAFMGTINSNLGNGSIAGMGTALFLGGPGAALWVVIFGLILMSVRFAEVYISVLYGMKSDKKSVLGGPMVYLKDVPGGKFLPHVYAVFCLVYGLLGGCSFQANSIQVSLKTTWGISPFVSGGLLFVFVLYILCGGAQRIIKISLSLVPLKVLVFLVSTAAILMYHCAALPAAFSLIISSGLGMNAFVGGVVGFSLQQAITAGMTSSIFATESGLGSAAILFGSTGSNDPIQSGLMGMVSTFLSMLTGFIVALCIVVSGVWNSGLNSTALTIAAFETVFGNFAGWIVSFLSITFGFGVLVSFAYISRSIWLFITNNRFPQAFIALYSLFTLGGALATVVIVWDLINIAVAGTLLINLFGIVMLLPSIRTTLLNQLRNYRA